MARIILEHNGQVLKDFPFYKGSITIGRRDDNTVVLHDPEVSGFHARIDKRGFEFILTDLQSTNGTFVNNRKVVSHRLSHGDRITISKHALLFIGTEKARVDAEQEGIPLDRTVILGGARQRKKTPPPPINADPVSIPHPHSDGVLGRLILLFILVGIILGLGVFGFKHKIPFFGGIILHDTGVGKIENRPTQATHPEPRAGEFQQDATQEIVGTDANPPPAIEAIIWSSDETKSFALINGKKVKTGESVKGMTVTKIGRDYVLLSSQDGQSILRLTLTLK
jgi:pSer/pThr/pTyr-binding forkhead associated (FHA) protein